ncbi:MAG: PLP-dependent aspartate aminotransferase family protein [Elusimicrobiota bacterium]|nr:PLP-dependent aspartate aminotransferase family protein [Elusimicrobiota bacterium]
MGADTVCVHGGISEDKHTGAVSIPIYQSSTYRQLEMGKNQGYDYGRSGNPTREALEALIADLEEGTDGFAFASGLAAITTVLMLFKSGDKIIMGQDIYGGTFRILTKIYNNFNINCIIVDTSDLSAIKEALAKDKSIKSIIMESPANPLLKITDIKAVAEIAKANNVLTIVDNTFMSPYLQKPLNLGVDIVIHSATKYLGGHSDVIAGLVAVKNKDLAEKVKFYQNAAGTILEPFDSWLLIRGIKTLSVRMDRHLQNAAFLADFLKNLTEVSKINYPGLKEFNGYEINKKQSKGAGAVISFEFDDKAKINLNEFFKNLHIIAFAESLGGVESLICHPATMTHASIPQEARTKMGITNNLVRFSVGIETKEDLADDLMQAIKKARV